ncbi:MAG: amino acid ABC transporter permease, partial [Chloroflexi bacterium]|nr:amino acid ABC transporter permease [Chloroflexota bacterium]
YIEIVRGAPLLGWLFVALFILDDIIGGDLIIRAMVVMAVFTGAYMAEYIRGALQALPRGQYEAGQAVGLSQWQRTRLIIMPQALRISIPPMVGQAISIWKDTTLVTVILPLRELKGNADSAISQFEFTPDRIEAYVFVAVIFWIVAFMMSRISQRVERAQGVGER